MDVQLLRKGTPIPLVAYEPAVPGIDTSAPTPLPAPVMVATDDPTMAEPVLVTGICMSQCYHKIYTYPLRKGLPSDMDN